MVTLQIILIPIIGFFIGYFTNYVAIKMLFYPRKKLFGMHGVIPKRRKLLARKISETSVVILPKSVKNLKKFPVVGNKIIDSFKHSVEKQINALSDTELEKMIYDVMRTEMNVITFLGGVIGFFMGLIQVLLLLYT